jgi:glycerophosphoryl diester phosphodiesterase
LKRVFFNKRNLTIFVMVVITILFVSENQKSNSVEPYKDPVAYPLVAHAGGTIYGFRYTNSLEAIEESYNNGFRFIELDFEWTKDDEVVIIHDWDSMVQRLFKTAPGVLMWKEFKSAKIFQDLTLMDLDDLAAWLEKRNDAYIITDAKKGNLKFLEYVKEKYRHIQWQIIPQIYSFEEYSQVKKMGYNNIILTLYRLHNNNNEIVNFVRDNPVFAVTMPIELGYTELPVRLEEVNIPTYVHTVNDLYIFEELNKNGVFGIYTDYFQPDHWID